MRANPTREQINATNLGMIANNATYDKAEIISLQYFRGYAELKLRNGLFTVVELKDDVTVEIRIPSLGGFKAIISIYDISSLIAKLSN